MSFLAKRKGLKEGWTGPTPGPARWDRPDFEVTLKFDNQLCSLRAVCKYLYVTQQQHIRKNQHNNSVFSLLSNNTVQISDSKPISNILTCKMLDHSNNHFQEEFCAEFSSPMQSYSRSESFLHHVTNSTTPSTSTSSSTDSNSPACAGISSTNIASSVSASTGYETRMATECNSMKISIDGESGKMRVVTQKLGQSRSGKQDDKCCIAYTYLPLSQSLPQGSTNGFLEAYVVTDRQPGASAMAINDSAHRSVISQTVSALTPASSATSMSIASIGGDASKTTASSHHGMAGNGNGGNNSSYGGAGGGANQNPMEEAKISMDRSQHKLQEYQLVITGYIVLPTSSESRFDTKTTSHEHAHAHGKQGEKPISGRRDRQRKKPKNENETNFYQTMSVLTRPSTIELCHIESQSDLSGVSSGLPKFALFLGSGTEVKMYTLSLMSIHDPATAADINSNPTTRGDEWFRIKPMTISNHTQTQTEKQSKTTALDSANAPSNDFISLLLQHRRPLTVNPSPLLFASPITAMSSFTQVNHLDRPYMNGLSVGCQDGSIRLITFLSKSPLKTEQDDDDDDGGGFGGGSFELLNISEYVLDGSITSLSFQCQCRQDDKTERLVLFAGSVSGFACSFLQKSIDSTAFEDPCPIIEGLWDAKLDDEDSVLTICEFQCSAVKSGRAIALGLYSGRILLFTECSPAQEYEIDSHSHNHSHSHSDLDDSVHAFESYPRYECFWYCNLPYPVHGIRASASRNELFPELVVCTRRTLHLFRSTPEFIAEATLERIEDLISKYKKNDFNLSINEHEVFVDTTRVCEDINLKF